MFGLDNLFVSIYWVTHYEDKTLTIISSATPWHNLLQKGHNLTLMHDKYVKLFLKDVSSKVWSLFLLAHHLSQ